MLQEAHLTRRVGKAAAVAFLSASMLLGVAAMEPGPQARQSNHWSFVSPSMPEVPPVADSAWPRNPIDAFVLSRLQQYGIEPAPEAARETQFRRIHLDLIGLPPAPDEVDVFLGDADPASYERAVDRLLSNPHFGEKWARWWLDLASYADSDGYLSDFLRPYAWRYRQWVVDALNDNMPFDQFTVEQLAGDLIPNATESQRIATGFNRNTLSNREGGADLEEFRVRKIVARANNIGTVWLGLTVGCAQCHDHKYDPISQEEYFQLYSFFNTSDEFNVFAPIGDEWERYQAAKAKHDAGRESVLAPIAGEIAALQAEWERRMLEAADNPDTADSTWARAWEVLGLVWGQNFGEGQLEGTLIVRMPLDERTTEQKDRLLDYFLENGSRVNEARWAELKLSEVSKQLKELSAALPHVTRAQTIAEVRPARPNYIHRRGDFRSAGKTVTPGTPAVLPALDVEGSPTRLDLAHWLVRRDNPLTARVVVNRLWQELFGLGLVATPEDFGTRGAAPSHPELLDWLAIDFMDHGWDLKRLIRTIVTSAAYRQSSHARPELREIDPNNSLLARQARLRLSGELVRDAALFASGLLDPRIGGPSVRPPQPDSVTMEGFMNTWTPSEGGDKYRRGLYTFIQRTSPYGQLVTFDFPDPNRPCARRERSNTPLQALNLLNDPVFVEAAQALADRVESFALRTARERGSVDTNDCIDYAFKLCLSRLPKDNERARLARYLDQQVQLFRANPEHARLLLATQSHGEDSAEPAAWTALASVILNLDEFITRE